MIDRHENKTAAADASPPSTQVDPPKIYFAACGALCDVFWWARRDPPAEDPPPPVRNS
jgi:hypothetical protein